jgi:hypothetical protein
MTTFNGVMDAASRNASSSNDLTMAAGEIIAKRMALGMAAAFNPMGADHAEFGRMMPEKMEAFTAAGNIAMAETNQAGWAIARLASDEMMVTARATIAMVTCSSPVAMAEAQGQFALDWFNRAATNFFAMGMLALGVQEAAMVPIQATVAANTERLGR